MRNAGAFRKLFGVLLSAAILCLNATPQAQSLRSLPGEIRIAQGQQQVLDFFFPLKVQVEGESATVSHDNQQRLADVGVSSVTITPKSQGVTHVTLSLLGFIPIKTVSVNVYPDKVLVPGGQSIGVTLRTAGVLVVGLSDVVDVRGATLSPAREAGIEVGDELIAVNGVTIKDKDHLAAVLESGKTMTVTVKRDGNTLEMPISVAADAGGIARIGAWVRDSTAGVGTLSYYDPSASAFGALGHAITEADTGTLMSVGEGRMYYSSIVDVVKGHKGAPGELRGVFSAEAEPYGSIGLNTIYGVFGLSGTAPRGSLYPGGLPIAMQSQVHTGPASILTTLDDQGVQEFSARIVSTTAQSEPSQRSMVVEITDQRLLNTTGGIVQGMSGSPIIQDGKIIGAITHVYVNDPTRGYGIYIEWMLRQEEALTT